MNRLPAARWSGWKVALWGAVVGLALPGIGKAQETAPVPTGLPPVVEIVPPAPVAPTLSAADEATIQRLVEQYVKEAEAKRKAEEEQKKKDEAAKPVEVLNNTSLSATWDNGLFFVSPNKDWRVHLGGRFEANAVWWQQPVAMKAPPPGPGGVPGARVDGGVGVGPLVDGTYFRRVRFRADGTAYENVEFVEEVDFENLNLITFDHIWAGLKNVPLLGTVRVGQMKVPQGLDMMGSDYWLTFLERSALSDAFWTLFAPGIYVTNNYFDQNVSTHAMFSKIQPLQYYDGAVFGDGDYAWTGRLTWTPYYAYDGAGVVHLGGSYQWRHGNLGRDIFPGGTGNAYADTQNVVRFRARPELRDGVGILTPTIGITGRFVETGYLLARDVQTISPEFMTTLGPLNFRAEGAFAYVNDAFSIYPAADFNKARGNPMFWGGYAQVSYFLTGEHWGYDRRLGMYDRPKVNENAFLVRGEDGHYNYGCGAWELAYRFSYVDLNDNGIDGGLLTENTFGVNWYLNDNLRIQANYVNILRNVAAPSVSGTVHGVGMQVQWYF